MKWLIFTGLKIVEIVCFVGYLLFTCWLGKIVTLYLDGELPTEIHFAWIACFIGGLLCQIAIALTIAVIYFVILQNIEWTKIIMKRLK